MDIVELEALLAELHRIRRDHGWVEVKRAEHAFPIDAWTTMSAFANTSGGLLLLGVDERSGFAVSGVKETAVVMEQLQQACTELEPVLRPVIDIVDHPDGTVIAVEIPAVVRTRRPCHLRARGPFAASYVRVGDADERLTEPEVAEMLAAREGQDHSARPAPAGAELDPAKVEMFVDDVRRAAQRYATESDEAILRAWSVHADERPTLAGLLTLGQDPARLVAAARIAYRVLPSAGAPPGARFAATHLEGTIGELVDGTLGRLWTDLRTYQVALRTGEVINQLDVPEEALREILSNALLHRSFTDDQTSVSVTVEVTDEAVRITSPGGLHVTADIATLGIAPLSGVRNLALVRICELARTPSGARILENQASGIRAADIAARRQGAAPPIFVDHAARFEVLLLRGAVDAAAAESAPLGGATHPDDLRLLAWAKRHEALREEADPGHVASAALDARFAARLLAPSLPDLAAVRLAALERVGALRRSRRAGRVVWEPAPAEIREPAPGSRRDRVRETVEAIARLGGDASRADLMGELRLRSNRSVSLRLSEAIQAGMVEATTDNPYDPSRAYRLTAVGEALVRP